MLTNGIAPLSDLPGYRILKKLGEGGTGAVFRAEHLDSGRSVAVKLLAPSEQSDDCARMEREGRLMASLEHPNVVRIQDWGDIGGRCYLVMEYVHGPSLRQALEPQTPWRVSSAASLLDAIARALAYIHERGVLHLDLKPENVLLQASAGRQEAAVADQGWIPKITDFGLALPRLTQPAVARLSSVQGSIDYCAPEVRYGLPIDARADVFALATLAYEVLTGRLPSRVFLPASSRNPRVPAAVDEVLRRGLARDPDDRYACVNAFRADLIARLSEAPSHS